MTACLHASVRPRCTASARSRHRAAAVVLMAMLTLLVASATAHAFGSSDVAWRAYYGEPSNSATWGPFCSGGGGKVVASGDGVMACGPTGGTGIEIPGPGLSKGISTPGFQCVELSERFLFVTHGWGTIGANGAQVAQRYASAHGVPLITNGTPGVAPQVGDVMSFAENASFSGEGHTGVVVASSVNSEGDGSIELLSENWEHTGNKRVVKVAKWVVASIGFPDTEWIQSGSSNIGKLPTITRVSPEAAGPGVPVTIEGTNLSSAQVRFGERATSLAGDSSTKIAVTVPRGATKLPCDRRNPWRANVLAVHGQRRRGCRHWRPSG